MTTLSQTILAVLSLLMLSSTSRLMAQIQTVVPNISASIFSAAGVDIDYQLLDEKKKFKLPEKDRRDSWSQSCQNIGRYLEIGQGYWGSGVFANFSCFYKSNSDKKASFENIWRITFVEKKKSIYAKIELRIKDAKPLLILDEKFSAVENSLEMLHDDNFARAYAYYLTLHLPYGYVFNKSRVKDQSLTLLEKTPDSSGAKTETPGKTKPVPTPKKIDLFSVAYIPQKKLWQIEFIGEASKQIEIENEVSYEIARSRVNKSEFPEVLFGADANREMALNDQKHILVEEKVEREKLINEKYADFFDKTFGMFKKTISKGYLGLRLGKQVLPGSSLASKMYLFGLLAEMREGPLKGVRFYYDKVPSVEELDRGEKTSIGWSRFMVGYSLGVALPFFADRIDVTAKVGHWSVGTSLLIDEADGLSTRALSFKMNSEFSLGIEPGLEWYFSDSMLRIFGALDKNLPLRKNSTIYISTYRFGLDYWYLNGPVISRFLRTAFLGFLMFEAVNLRDSGISNSDSSVVEGINYTTGFVGLGAAISW